jgi:hypothetical protein
VKDDQIIKQIKDSSRMSVNYIMYKYKYTYIKTYQLYQKWQALQPIPILYKKESKKLRKTKWNIGGRLFENYEQWKEAMNG